VSNEKAVVEPVAMSTASGPQSELAPESTAEMTKDDQNTELSEQTAKIHVVKPGENLYRISLLHNIKMATLREWNNIDNTGAIIAGQSIWLVPPSMQED
jgi:type IV pilus assembly protein PilF